VNVATTGAGLFTNAASGATAGRSRETPTEVSCMSILNDLAQAIIDCDEEKAPELTQQALDQGLDPQEILSDGLLKGMGEVGKLFRDGEYFVPEVLIAAEAMKSSTTILKPHLQAAGAKAKATAVVGTVKGDLHDIGKNLVCTMLEGAGFEIIDLGVDVPPEKFVEACQQQPVQLVALSALLTTTMPMMETTVKKLVDELSDKPVILVGGAPVTQDFAEKIGAQGYGRDAASGADIAKELVFKQAS
jgi:5-methyltetrahydrofolate--homocysteine methyltransferase